MTTTLTHQLTQQIDRRVQVTIEDNPKRISFSFLDMNIQTIRRNAVRSLALGAALLAPLALASPASASCDYAGGHNSSYSWTSDGNNNCQTIGTNTYVADESGAVWLGWKYANGVWVQQGSGGVLSSASTGW